MNDFTKEELESIIEAFEYIESDPAWRKITGWDDGLKIKIQSMIDNYCEITIPTMASYVCNKCNEEWHNCECKKL